MFKIAEDNDYAQRLGENGMMVYNQLKVKTISKQWIIYLNKI